MNVPALIDLWFVRTDAVRDMGLVRACEAILQPEERDQQQKTARGTEHGRGESRDADVHFTAFVAATALPG